MVQLNQDHDAVSTYENTAEVLTPIFVATVPDKVQWNILDGTLLVCKLQDSSPSEIAASSVIHLAGKRTTPVFPEGHLQRSYRPFSNLTVAQQYSEDKQAQIRLKIPPGKLMFAENWTIEFWLKSDDVIDWDHSLIEFDVEELAYREPQV